MTKISMIGLAALLGFTGNMSSNAAIDLDFWAGYPAPFLGVFLGATLVGTALDGAQMVSDGKPSSDFDWTVLPRPGGFAVVGTF